MTRKSKDQEPLLSLRSAVVFLIGTQAAGVAGILAHMAGTPLATAVLTGTAAFGGAIAFARSAIG